MQQYENFIQSGLSILDKCVPDTEDANDINKRIEEVNKTWDKLQNKLGEREDSLKKMQDLSARYASDLQSLGEWISTVTEELEGIAPIGTQPEVIAEQRLQVQVSHGTP